MLGGYKDRPPRTNAPALPIRKPNVKLGHVYVRVDAINHRPRFKAELISCAVVQIGWRIAVEIAERKVGHRHCDTLGCRLYVTCREWCIHLPSPICRLCGDVSTLRLTYSAVNTNLRKVAKKLVALSPLHSAYAWRIVVVNARRVDV